MIRDIARSIVAIKYFELKLGEAASGEKGRCSGNIDRNIQKEFRKAAKFRELLRPGEGAGQAGGAT